MADYKGKDLTPWERVALLDRAIAGEDRAKLQQEFGVHRATINRWVARWGDKRKMAKQPILVASA